MKYKIGVVGFFAGGRSRAGGQEAKTWAITEALTERFGEACICTADTTDWKRHPFRLFFRLVGMAARCRNIIMLPAQNSVAVFIPLFLLLRGLFHNSLHYVVVGGWLASRLAKLPRLKAMAARLDGIYVETGTLRRELEALGLDNVDSLPNFKYISVLDAGDMQMHDAEPYPFCFFSRIMPEKGVEDAIAAVSRVNDRFGRTVCTLDLYGVIQPGQDEWFAAVRERLPPFVRYCGFVEPDQSVGVLKDYFALLFPTRYPTEGVPGTVIDAFAAGVPVISAEWESCADVMEDGKTGAVFPMRDVDALTDEITHAAKNPAAWNAMKPYCLEKAQAYRPERVIDVLASRLV